MVIIMKLSVIVPVYKVEKYIQRCLESIINQTYRDLEIILIDDESPDNCGKICDEYAKKDNRIRVIHQKNGKQSGARNSGLDIATGDYVTFVDSDDWIDEDMYRTIIEIAENKHADIVECGYRFYRPWKTENKYLCFDDTEKISEFTNTEALNMLYFGPQRFGGLTIMVWNKIYRAELLKNIRFLKGYIFEDVEFTPKAFFYANKIVKYEKTYYNYNIHLGTNETSAMKNNILKVRSIVYIHEMLNEFFSKNYVQKISEYQEEAYYSSLINSYCDCFEQRKNKEFDSLREECRSILFDNKKRVKKVCNDWKTKMFFFSPMLYYAIRIAYQRLKK